MCRTLHQPAANTKIIKVLGYKMPSMSSFKEVALLKNKYTDGN